VASRREARRIAVDVLYQADVTGHAPGGVVAEWHEAGRDIPTFSRELIEGVEAHLPSIDLLLERDAEEWSVDRMTSLDRTILRIAVEELLYRDDVPASVAISEAVEAAAELSTDESKRFVNGILGRIARVGREAGPGGSGCRRLLCRFGWFGGRRRGRSGGRRLRRVLDGTLVHPLLELTLSAADVASDIGDLLRAEQDGDRDDADDDPFRSHGSDAPFAFGKLRPSIRREDRGEQADADRKLPLSR